jgi:hypothetical protein
VWLAVIEAGKGRMCWHNVKLCVWRGRGSSEEEVCQYSERVRLLKSPAAHTFPTEQQQI